MKKVFFTVVVMVAILLMAGSSFAATYDATGTWTGTISNPWIDPGNAECEGGLYGTEPTDITITQNGNSVTMVNSGTSYQGTISGATYSVSASYPEDNGTVTESVTITLTSNTSGSGKGEWEWRSGGYYCSGGADITITKKDSGGSGGAGGNVSGSGTRRNPYIMELDQTYDITVMGYRNLCGSFDLSCSSFDSDVISLKVSIPQAGQYRATFSQVDSNRDLVAYIYEADSPGSTQITYVAELDNAGQGGTESVTADMKATDIYVFLIVWGGSDTIQAKFESVSNGGGGDGGYDASGTWTISTSNHWIDQGNAGDCEGGSDDTFDIRLNQTGNSVTIVLRGRSYPGTVSGATYTGSVSYAEDDGTTTETVTFTLTSNTSGAGKGEWEWRGGGYYCSGGYQINMTRGGSDGGTGGGGGGGGCFVTSIVADY